MPLLPDARGQGSSTVRLRWRDETVWDALWTRRSIGRIAIAVGPSQDRIRNRRETPQYLVPGEPHRIPPGYTVDWREALVADVAQLEASMEMPGDGLAALHVPRFVHGQSQGLCDLFGAKVEAMPDGNCYVHPLPPDPVAIQRLTPRPVETSQYWGAVEYARYVRESVGNRFPLRNPVMVGPLDMANYLLGTQTLLEWVYLEPDTVHVFLDRITQVIIDMVSAWREAAHGHTATHHLKCMRGGFDLCSECRSLISLEVYETFEAPRLRRLGERLGPYAVHSCGSWERTVPSAVADPNLRAMNGQVRENDLDQLCRLAEGRITLSIGPSQNVHTQYTWKDTASFYTYILKTVPLSQPFEVAVQEEDVPLWNDLCGRLGKVHNRVSPGG